MIHEPGAAVFGVLPWAWNKIGSFGRVLPTQNLHSFSFLMGISLAPLGRDCPTARPVIQFGPLWGVVQWQHVSLWS